MPEYLISFNDEWVAEHTPEQIAEKAVASRALIEAMQQEGVLLFANGALDRTTVLCSVRAIDGEPVFADGPAVDRAQYLGGFTVIDVPDDETARHWAGRLAVVLDWPQEVHRFRGPGEVASVHKQ
mgnify:CR=1 FL=1